MELFLKVLLQQVSCTSTGSMLHEGFALISHSKTAPILCKAFISLPVKKNKINA